MNTDEHLQIVKDALAREVQMMELARDELPGDSHLRSLCTLLVESLRNCAEGYPVPPPRAADRVTTQADRAVTKP